MDNVAARRPRSKDVLALAEAAWNGELGGDVRVESFVTGTSAPVVTHKSNGGHGVADSGEVHFLCTFANSVLIDLPNGAVMVVDTGSAAMGKKILGLVRQIRPDSPVSHIVYTHGRSAFLAHLLDRLVPRPLL
jgi:Metallo-beta-lactamase superfamily